MLTGPQRLLAGALAGLLVAGGAGIAHVRARRAALRAPARVAAAPPPAGPGWPGAQARLEAPEVAFPAGFGRRRVYLDAGHGAPGNRGNTSCFCADEQDFTAFAAAEIGRRLEATGHFDVRLSRRSSDPIAYRDRVEDAQAWGAQALVSLHSDVRSRADRWSPDAGADCPVSYAAPGFAVLYSDAGGAEAVGQRRGLARAMAHRLAATGLLAYDGAEYAHLYAADPSQPGAFVDRHAPEQRIYMLHKPSMPSILVETHHALDPREELRWHEPATLDAFAAATAGALVDALGSTRLSLSAAALEADPGAPK